VEKSQSDFGQYQYCHIASLKISPMHVLAPHHMGKLAPSTKSRKIKEAEK
jgi:hypothetical protein